MRQVTAVAMVISIVVLAGPVAAIASGSDQVGSLERLYQAWLGQVQLELARPPQPGSLGALPALPELKVPELALPSDAPLPDPDELLPPLPELPELSGPSLIEEHFGGWSNVRAGLEARLPALELEPADMPSLAEQRAFLEGVPAPEPAQLPQLELPKLGPLPDLASKRGFQDLTALAGNLGLDLTPAELAALDPSGSVWQERFEDRVAQLDATLGDFTVPAARFPEAPKRQGVDLAAAFKQAQEALKARVAPWQEQLWNRAKSLLGGRVAQAFKDVRDFLVQPDVAR